MKHFTQQIELTEKQTFVNLAYFPEETSSVNFYQYETHYTIRIYA
jgi:hypothetical protein